MAITVKFYGSDGHEYTSRQFQPGQLLDVNVFVEDFSGFYEPFSNVSIDIFNGTHLIYTKSTGANFFGVCDFQLMVPLDVSGAGKIHVIATHAILPDEVQDVPIAFGDTEPEPLPDPSNWLKDLGTGLLIIGIIGVGIYAYYKGKK